MDIKQLHHYPRETIEQLLAAIPFYKSVRQQDPWQFELLLKHSRIVTCRAGEVLLQRGETDHWLYFLLKGRLAVYPKKEAKGEPINYITPGEVFGDLAMLVDFERTATVVAAPEASQVIVFGTDFKAFGALDDFSIINMQTKLAYYRNSVHNLRWKLDVYRAKHPDFELASQHHKVRLYIGVKDTSEELRSLHDQAKSLARLLIAWNREFGEIDTAAEPCSNLVAAIE